MREGATPPDQSLSLGFNDGWEAVEQMHRALQGASFRLGFSSSDPEMAMAYAVHNINSAGEYVFVLSPESSATPVKIFDLKVYEKWAELTTKQGLSEDTFEPDLADEHVRLQEEMGMIVPNPVDIRDFRRLLVDFAEKPKVRLK